MFPAILKNVSFLINQFLIMQLDHLHDFIQLTNYLRTGENNKWRTILRGKGLHEISESKDYA